MRIAFLDFVNWDYIVETAYERPLGGSQSALCYLAEELARAGHEVFLLNGVASETVSRGVRCLPLKGMTRGLLGSFDRVVIQNNVKPALSVKPHLRSDARLILWTQHAHDQPAVQDLAQPEIRQAFDTIALVSRWQFDCYRQAFQLDETKCRVLRNAIAPAFESLFPNGEPILSGKARPPVLAYTSTPFRGLEVLLAVFPRIRAAVPGTRLRVYSSMQVYQMSPEKDAAKFGELYGQCRETDGVEYIGSVPQPQLASELVAASVLVYPNHFAETSCIAVMEAMAVGCRIVTSELGALPETCAGFARLISVADDWNVYAEQFVAATVEVLGQSDRESELRRQVDYVNANCTWRVRALEWAKWLE